MKELLPGLFIVEPTKASELKYISFFVKRKSGNLLFPCFSNQSTIHGRFAEFAAQGGISMQLLGDSHFRTAHCDEVSAEFGCSLYCSTAEEASVREKVVNVTAFPFERHMLATDIEVLPTPGHRPGGVCYLVRLGKLRVLFAGDALWFDGNAWRSFPSSKGKKQLIASFELLKSVDFDAVTCNSKVRDQEHCIMQFANRTERQAFLDTQIALIS